MRGVTEVMERKALIQQIVADLRQEAFLAVCKAIDTPKINLAATEANCQVIELVADYIEDRWS
jgi:hypothetical protein